MSRSKFVPLLKSLLPDLPNFATKGRVLFMTPIGHMLPGISFEPSAFSNISFYITKFVMPLCVPSSFIYFNFGGRMQPLTTGVGWGMDMPNLKEELVDVIQQVGVPFISTRASLLGFVESTPASDNMHTLQAIAYCLARAGQIIQSIQILDRLLATDINDIPWQHDLINQARALRLKLIADPAAAQEQLIGWETETVHHLGLTKFRVDI